MKSPLVKSLAAAALFSAFSASSIAAVFVDERVAAGLTVTIDNETFEINPVLTFDEDKSKRVWVVDNFSNQNLGISGITTVMDPDPIITSAVSVLDIGSATNFTFSWLLDMVPDLAGPVTLKLTLGGSCTDNNNNGCSVTPNLASGLFADGLMDSVIYVSGGGAFTGPAGGSGSFASTTFIVNVPGGPRDYLGLNLGFLGSGGGDAISFTLSVEALQAVPEPTSWALVGIALGAAGLASRRRKAA